MPSEKEICNLAIRRLGEQVNLVSLTEDSAYAEIAKATYPVVRDTLLERHAWNFATTRTRAALVNKEPIGWKYMYHLPAKCVRVLSLSSETAPLRELETGPWVVEADGDYRVLLCNVEDVVLKYVSHVTNTAIFSPGFTDTLAWYLAANLAGPIIKGETGLTISNKLMQFAMVSEQKAIETDTRQRRTIRYQPLTFIDREIEGWDWARPEILPWNAYLEIR